MYQLIKPILFNLDPERAHLLVMRQLSWLTRMPLVRDGLEKLWANDDRRLVTRKLGLTFKNPIGLAAGFDKNAEYVSSLPYLGFGFVEVGTITPKAQAGNPTPRLFRLPEDEALINRMGFNNLGVDKMVSNLKKAAPYRFVVGGNIGKNKVTPNENAIDDYLSTYHKLHNEVDYFVVNVSSPNTPGLRELQDKGPLTKLLRAIQTVNGATAAPKPILLKIAPDLSMPQLDDVLTVVSDCELDGLIATNTTLNREGLSTAGSRLKQIGPGGLSGAPLSSRSDDFVRYIRSHVDNDFTIVGVGGIHSADDALRKFDAGADLIQIYTGLIYKGPKLIQDIKKALIQRASRA